MGLWINTRWTLPALSPALGGIEGDLGLIHVGRWTPADGWQRNEREKQLFTHKFAGLGNMLSQIWVNNFPP